MRYCSTYHFETYSHYAVFLGFCLIQFRYLSKIYIYIYILTMFSLDDFRCADNFMLEACE